MTPYNLATVHPSIRPIGDAVEVGDIWFETYVPRRSRERDSDGNRVYWCLSCDRRVDNHNQPFCEPEHRDARAKERRRRRAEAARPLRVSATVVAGLHERRRALSSALTRYKFASDQPAQAARWQELESEFDRFDEFLRSNFSK